jgi:hypothetical protein
VKRQIDILRKRKQRADAKKLREQQAASVPSLSKNGKAGTKARATNVEKKQVRK